MARGRIYLMTTRLINRRGGYPPPGRSSAPRVWIGIKKKNSKNMEVFALIFKGIKMISVFKGQAVALWEDCLRMVGSDARMRLLGQVCSAGAPVGRDVGIFFGCEV